MAETLCVSIVLVVAMMQRTVKAKVIKVRSAIYLTLCFREVLRSLDCVGQFKENSLNQQVLQGSDNTNNLFGVLIRFRKLPVAVVSDVRAMFMQAKVDPLDQSALCFLWWTDQTRLPRSINRRFICFDLTSSPSVVDFTLRRTAKDNRSQLEDDVRQMVFENIYVNDLLVSTPDENTATTLIKEWFHC